MGADIITDETSDAYHANPCVSNSKLNVLREGGPALFHGRFIARTIPRPKPTEALIFGCQFDTLLTESRAKFAERYVIKPQGMKFNTNEGKAWRAAQGRSEEDIVEWKEWEKMERMEQAALADPLFRTFVHPKMISQATVRLASSSYGIGVQSRPDWLSEVPNEFSDGRPYSVNLKTTADWSDWFNDADPDSPRNGIPVYTHGYHRQAALDQWVLFQSRIGETAHFLLVIEKQEPFRVGWVQLTDAYLEAGWWQVEADLSRLKHHIATNSWPKTPGGVRKLSPPRFEVEKGERAAAMKAAG